MAYNGFHRSVKAGVALAGAGAIAFASVPMLPTDEIVVAAPRGVAAASALAPRALTIEVAPVSLISALQTLAQGAADTVTATVNAVQNDVPAIFNQVAEQWADINLTPWNHSLVAAALIAPIAPLLVGPFNDAVANVLADLAPQYDDEIREGLPEAIEYAFARVVGPFLSAFGATGAVHQDYYHAGMAGDNLGQNLALLNAPAKVIEAFLFGGYGDLGPLFNGPGSDRIAAPGLLTPWGAWPADRNVVIDDDGLPDNEFVTLAIETGEAEDSIVESGETPAVDAALTTEVVTEQVSETVEGDEVPAAELTEETVTEETVPEETVTEETATEVPLTDEVTDEEAVDDEKDEAEPARFSIRQGLDHLRENVEKLTGISTGRADKSADAEKADKAEKADRPEKADKAEASETTKSESAASDKGDTE